MPESIKKRNFPLVDATPIKSLVPVASVTVPTQSPAAAVVSTTTGVPPQPPQPQPTIS